MRSTNRKLIELTPTGTTTGAPTWAPFRGWSVLFTPTPPAPSGAAGALVPLDHAGHHRSVVELYDGLAAWFHGVTAPRRARPLVAAVPPWTYHVTVCDGLSDGVLAQTTGHAHRRIAEVLDSLPGAIATGDPGALGAPRRLERLVAAGRRPVELRVEAVHARGHAVLADLVPTRATAAAFEHIAAERHAVLTELGDDVGLPLATPWRPHVTLAYAATRDDASRFVARLDTSAVLDDAPARFDAADVVAFDDMVTYWRRAH